MQLAELTQRVNACHGGIHFKVNDLQMKISGQLRFLGLKQRDTGFLLNFVSTHTRREFDEFQAIRGDIYYPQVGDDAIHDTFAR